MSQILEDYKPELRFVVDWLNAEGEILNTRRLKVGSDEYNQFSRLSHQDILAQVAGATHVAMEFE